MREELLLKFKGLYFEYFIEKSFNFPNIEGQSNYFILCSYCSPIEQLTNLFQLY